MLARVLHTCKTAPSKWRCFSSLEGLERTALYGLHEELGGKMVEFAGYALPVQYRDGVLKSHLHTRDDNGASLFDVSHMGQIHWHGKDRVEFLERVLVGDIAGLDKGKATLSVITNENGGIVDDTVVTNMGDYVNMVVNGATKYKDMKHFDNVLQEFKSAGKDVGYEYFHERQLIALQGPAAARVLARHVEDPSVLPKLGFMESTPLKVAGIKDAVVTRCGYTGEDGFEISLPWNEAEKAARAFLAEEEVLEAGLGARDSLRLEAGLCLYGHDIDETTSPVEAALNWTIAKRRREDGRFIGADKILPQLKKGGVSRKRVGLIIDGPPAREGVSIVDDDGNEIGKITSGTFSPCLKKPISMGYVPMGSQKAGTTVKVSVRNKISEATVTKMPFVEARYYKP